jgi:hypothetical protein
MFKTNPAKVKSKNTTMTTYIILFVLIAAVSVAALRALSKGNKHRRKQLRIAEAYDRFVRQFKLAIEYSEFLCYRYIGLDRKNRKLVLIDHCGNEKQEQCISLYEIGESKIIHAKDESQNTKTIMLELRNRYDNQPVRFCFYNRDYDLAVELPSLSSKAMHWKCKVDTHKNRGNINLEADYVL